MRTKGAIGVILAFGLAFALMSGSGIGAVVFGENPDDAESSGTLDELIDGADVDEDEDGGGGLSGNIGDDNEPTVTGFVISGAQFITELVRAVALLPLTLMRLGFPSYFAVPVGGIAQIIAFVGLIQFVTGRELL